IQQPRVPIMVGGNGPNVTWRLAAKFADELNLDGMTPDEVKESLPVVRSRCEEIGRDPSSLKISVHIWRERAGQPRRERTDSLGAYAAAGVDRVQTLIWESAADDGALESFAEDVRASGAQLATAEAVAG